MAGVSRVEFPNGTPIIDLTSDTVTADKMYVGITAHSANGDIITGTAEIIDDGEGNITLPEGLVTLIGEEDT